MGEGLAWREPVRALTRESAWRLAGAREALLNAMPESIQALPHPWSISPEALDCWWSAQDLEAADAELVSSLVPEELTLAPQACGTAAQRLASSSFRNYAWSALSYVVSSAPALPSDRRGREAARSAVFVSSEAIRLLQLEITHGVRREGVRSGVDLAEFQDLVQNSYGDLIREARQSLGLTQAELAARVSKTPQWVSTIEKGRTAAPLWLVMFLAEEPGVGLNFFFGQVPWGGPEHEESTRDKIIEVRAVLEDALCELDSAEAMGLLGSTVSRNPPRRTT